MIIRIAQVRQEITNFVHCEYLFNAYNNYMTEYAQSAEL